MKRFVEGEDRSQVTRPPECLDDYIGEDDPVRVIDVFVDELDLTGLGFDGVAPADTGRPAYHPAVLLKIYVYGYLNRLQSKSAPGTRDPTQRRADVADRRLAPDFKTIAEFRGTTARRSVTSVANSSSCAAGSICSPRRSWRSTAASSRRSTAPQAEVAPSVYPHFGCSRAMRTMSSAISRMIPGRPGPRRCAKFHFSATSRRCQRSSVSGETIVSSFSSALPQQP